MVTFTCQNCNASLKKKVVNNHRFQCKKSLHLTCIDCLKDFYGNQYESHISCVTESERYGGKNYTASNSENKHAAWMATIKHILDVLELSNEERNLLKTASANPNLPTNKKKFINYFTHLPPNYKVHLIESVYEKISNEHKKRQEANNQTKINKEVEESTKTEKKRKTISETQEDVIEPQVKQSDKEKKKKKKNKDRLTTEENADSQTETVDLHPKKKDKKKKKSVSYELSETSQVEDDSLNGEDCENGVTPAEPSLASEKSSIPVGEEETKLTKKEKKKLLKQQKYQAELESIEHYQEEKENDPGADEGGEKKKKSKRNKNIEGNNKGETFEQKRETKVSVSEPDGKKIRLEDGEEEVEEPVVEKPKKFKWDKMIIQVLRGADDNEMPLKRLSKKVCGEYMLIFGEKESYEDILLTFNKKVVKTQGVRVFKDRAKLIC